MLIQLDVSPPWQHAASNPSASSMDVPGLLHDRTALILYGSETGNAQDIAEELGRLTERLRFASRVAELDQVNIHDLLRSSFVVFVIATTGQGDLPANAQRFWKRLRSIRLQPGCLSDLCFASFGLGDSSYPQFNWAHRKLFNRLSQLGAKTFCDRGESDEQHPEGIEGCFLPWFGKLKQALLDQFPLPPSLLPVPDDEFLPPRWAITTIEDSSKLFGGQALAAVAGALENEANGDRDHPSSRNEAQTKSSGVLGAFTSTLVKNERLTPKDHWQDVRLFEFRCPALDYSPGDVLTIFPKNSKEDVNRLLSLMGWDEKADVPIIFEQTGKIEGSAYYPPAPFADKRTEAKLTLRTLLTDHLDITAIPRRSFFASIAHFTKDEMQKERLLEFTDPEYVDELYDYTTRPRRSIIEVLHEFDTVKIPLKWAASILPHIRGRQFSIASGGNLKFENDGSGRVELLVAIVKYRTVIKKIREGLCTKYLAALSPGAKLDVLLSRGGMTHSTDRPAIMIGPGTGVAPLRSMILERAAAGLTAQNLLFFGGRNKAADFFFKDEWTDLSATTGLKVFPAFSRDQKHKIYVQNLIRQQSRQVYEALTTGVVYICGSSGKMPQAVREALVEVFQEEGSMERAAAEACLARMEKDGRYQQETW